MPVRLVCGLSKTKNAARLAVYEATMIMAKPAQTMPKTLAEKLRGVPENKVIFMRFLTARRKAAVLKF